MFSIVSGINMGSSVVLAQAYGSGNREKMKRVIATSLFTIGWRVCCEPLVIIVSGINMGSSVVLAQAYGSGNREKMKRVIATSLFTIGWRVCCEPLVIPLYHCYV